MTVEEAEKYLADLEEIRGDDEAAHGLEDSFRAAVLEHIANGGKQGRLLAEMALRTDKIVFARWYA